MEIRVMEVNMVEVLARPLDLVVVQDTAVVMVEVLEVMVATEAALVLATAVAATVLALVVVTELVVKQKKA